MTTHYSLDIRDGVQNICNERLICIGSIVLGINLCELIADRRAAQVTDFDASSGGAVGEDIAMMRVILYCRYHLCQLLHIFWFNVDKIYQRVTKSESRIERERVVLKVVSLFSSFHILILKSSALMKVSPSLFRAKEFI